MTEEASTLIHLTGVRGGVVTTAFTMEGVDVATGSIVAWNVDWMQVGLPLEDKVRQIV